MPVAQRLYFVKLELLQLAEAVVKVTAAAAQELGYGQEPVLRREREQEQEQSTRLNWRWCGRQGREQVREQEQEQEQLLQLAPEWERVL
ncbi:hypothetical protein NLG97_g1710 [Lecanicillium saksenae]|uniref:Uncharacterized protein n=1 Tax=Lecanicillium saksenae TaxID=468837 RepID=A0ACC1R3M6_9HYPO|nr:hypothetical protein NLG97_g1710 [Lecanicillium saksenae]